MAATAQTNDQDIYPREDAAMVRQVDGQTVAVRPLKRVKTPTGEDAVAERIIVAFSTAIDTAAITDAHTTAASGGAGKARPVLDLGDNTFLVDVSGAASLERAMDAYRADSRVRSPEEAIANTPSPVRRTTRQPHAQYAPLLLVVEWDPRKLSTNLILQKR